MPLTIDPGRLAAIDDAELRARLADSRIDPADPAAFASLAPLLAALARHPRFLSDRAIALLEAAPAALRAGNGYGPQVIGLGSVGDRFVLRANLWPSRADTLLRTSGAAAFVYGLAHDHDFPFLTAGYLGPGYVSEDFTRAPSPWPLAPGAPAGLRAAGVSRLSPGTLLFYRPHVDIHRQHPPEALSVSLNILGRDPTARTRGQHRFDIEGDRVAARLDAAPAEALMTVAAAFGGAGEDIVGHIAATHADDRLRIAALGALADGAGAVGRDRLWRAASASPRAAVAAHARRRIAAETEAVRP